MAITFQVNLATTNVLTSKNPYSSNDPQGSNFASTRSTWFPDFLRDNHNLKHGDTLVVSGQQALYLLNNCTFLSTIPSGMLPSSGPSAKTNSNAAYCFLNYVSGTAV